MNTPDNITELAPNEIFVFGSNFAGRHGKGAALLARKKFGAVTGQGCGLMGRSYGIATKDARMMPLDLAEIERQVERFIAVAIARPKETFLVTKIGCGLAGYSPKQIAPMFANAPTNVILPVEFRGAKD